MTIDMERVKRELEYIAIGDHMGDVNNGLLDLAPALGFKAAWHDSKGRVVFEWEVACGGCGLTEEDFKYSDGECDCDDGVYKPVNLVEQVESW